MTDTRTEARLAHLERRMGVLERRVRLMVRGYVVLFVVTVLAAWGAYNAGQEISSFEHQGAVQRVTTISQRCDLTSKIKDVLGKDDPLRLPAFDLSYQECLVGLHKAEKLAGGNLRAETPTHAKH